MTEIIGVRFKSGGKEYYFNPNGMQFEPGQNVIIETARGVEFGECTQANTMVDEMTLISPLRPVLRAATPEDLRIVAANKKKEARAFDICEKKISEHKLDMKLVDVEYNFEGSKILFFFTSDGRVDFRELVKDLASVFHTRIELRQIGVRDEAKMLGGLGICGRPFCCSSFLEDFQPVSIKMAKTQNLSLNPTKISGTCGRLMCCLKYEQDAYEDALKRCPKNDSLVETPAGVGTVCQVNLLREQAKVRLDDSTEAPQVFPCSELKVIRSGKGKRPEGYELPEPAEMPEKPASLRKSAPPTARQNVTLPEENTDGAVVQPPPSSLEEEKPRRKPRKRARSEAIAEGTDQPTEQTSTPEKKKERPQQPRKQKAKPHPEAIAAEDKPVGDHSQEGDASAERKKEGQRRNGNRRYRPRHRGSRPKGEGGQSTAPNTTS